MTDYTDPAPVLAILREAGLPVAYRTWAPAKAPALPYVLFFRASRDDLMADDANYLKRARFCAQLYADGADFESMAAIERALGAHGVCYSADETGGGGLREPVAAVYYFDMLGAR